MGKWRRSELALLLTAVGALLAAGAAEAQGELFVADPFDAFLGGVTVYDRTASGGAFPLRQIPRLSRNLALDLTHNELTVLHPPSTLNPLGLESVNVYDVSASGFATPLRSLYGPTTGLNVAVAVALDLTHDELFVGNGGVGGDSSITVYSRTATGDAAPLRTLRGIVTGAAGAYDPNISIAVDPVNDELFVANTFFGAVLVYSRTASGNSPPLRVLQGPATGLGLAEGGGDGPRGLALDIKNNQLFVSRQGFVTVYDRTASGNSAPLRTLWTSQGPGVLIENFGLALDLVHEELFVGSIFDGVHVYSRTAGCNTPPPPPSCSASGFGCYAEPPDCNLSPLRRLARGGLPIAVAVAPNSLPELLDARDFIVGTGIDANPERLASGGASRHGVVADGVTKLLIRWDTGRAGVVSFSLAGMGQSRYDGLLSSLDGSQTGAAISVPTVDTPAGLKALAIYQAPADFVRPGAGDEANARRTIRLNMAFTPSSGPTVELAKTVDVVRPPVLLLHGFGTDKKKWDDVIPRLTQSINGLRVEARNYPSTASFQANRQAVSAMLSSMRDEVRQSGIAVTQIDVFGHSLGGLLGRWWAADVQYKLDDNYRAGDIHKLVTIDAPHAGTFLVDVIVKALEVLIGELAPELAPMLEAFDLLGMPLGLGGGALGAFDEMGTFSAALLSRLQQVTDVPAHAVAGDFEVAVGFDLAGLPGPLGGLFTVLRQRGLDTSVSVDLIPGASDLVATVESQAGRLLGPAKKTFNHIHFNGGFGDRLPGPLELRSDGSLPVAAWSIKLLNESIDSEMFQRGFPTQSRQAVHEQMKRAPSAARVRQLTRSLPIGTKTVALNGIQIASPAAGATVSPGQSLAIVVQPLAGVTLASVLVVTPEGVQEQTTAPFMFALPVPADAVGPLRILALGKSSVGGFFSDEIAVSVSPGASVQSLNMTPSGFHLQARGSTIQLEVRGLYSDGIERDVTSSGTGTTYAVGDSGIASVDVNGLVTGKGNGSTMVTAGNGSVSANMLLTVTAPAVNTAPVANAGAGQAVEAGDPVALDGTGSFDPDFNPLTYAWTQTGGPAVTLVDADSATPTVVLDAPGTYTFRLVVNDGEADSQPASVTILAANGATYQVTVQRTGTGGGTVTSTPSGINCGSICTAIFNNGTTGGSVLTATPAAGSKFSGWNGGGCSGRGTCAVAGNATITATFDEAVATFIDVPTTDPFFAWIDGLFAAGITGGCGTAPPQYCPGASVTRGQITVFLLRGIHGAGYQPPSATGTMFADVLGSHPFVTWIEQLARDGITGGCSTSPPQYCPENGVTRGQMAAFLLRAKHGAGYQPPDATGMFADVPLGHPFAKWIEQLAREGVTGGCGTSPVRYCPEDSVTRGQMAVFLVRAFNLPM